MTYIQHFAQNPADYLQYRPDYPRALFQFLVSLCRDCQLAWDCATGNGQAALSLASYFKQVIASDINHQSLNVAMQCKNISYFCWPSEQTELQAASIDLITVAQALHWFDLPSFYDEIRRIAKPRGVIAAWCYSLGNVSSQVDAVIRKLYDDILGDTFWPKERRYIDKEYKTIAFPFKKIATPMFQTEKSFQLTSMIGYLRTWSAVKEYQQRLNQDPIQLIVNDLEKAWGKSEKTYMMQWPLHLLVGHV